MFDERSRWGFEIAIPARFCDDHLDAERSRLPCRVRNARSGRQPRQHARDLYRLPLTGPARGRNTAFVERRGEGALLHPNFRKNKLTATN
jgi:hypothetical protein